MVEPVKLIDNFEAMYSYITNDDTKFYLQTNKNAPKYKVVSLDIHNHTVCIYLYLYFYIYKYLLLNQYNLIDLLYRK